MASVGATKKPMYRPIAARIAARRPSNQGTSAPASGRTRPARRSWKKRKVVLTVRVVGCHSVAMRSAARGRQRGDHGGEDEEGAEQRIVAARRLPGIDRRRPRRRRRSAPGCRAARSAGSAARRRCAGRASARRPGRRAGSAPACRARASATRASDRRRRHVEQQAEQRRRDDQRQAGDEPVRQPPWRPAIEHARGRAADDSICSSEPSARSPA